MKRRDYFSLIFLLTLLAVYSRLIYEDAAIIRPQPYESYRAGEYYALKAEEGWETANQSIYLFEEVRYRKNGIDVTYPHFTKGASEEAMTHWNQIIDQDIREIMEIYSFTPFPSPPPVPSSPEQKENLPGTGDTAPVYLRLTYEIKAADHSYFSVFYKVDFNPGFVAHPTELAYTTNISLTDSRRIGINDLVKTDEAFVKEFRQWEMISYEPENEELNLAIRDYFRGLSDSELLLGFQNADIIGAGNYLGIYSYLTPGRLGISIGAPNYLGDHVEFEKSFSELTEFLLPGTGLN